jgi:hypothetical protein
MSKQDRQGVRTPADLVQRYNLGDVTEVMGAAADARTAANEARNAAANMNNSLNPSTIFNLLTNYGTSQFIYKGEDGEIYINASYILAGILNADLIQTGSLDASLVNIKNLVAETLQSVLDNSQLNIAGAKMTLSSSNGETFSVGNVDERHACINMKKYDEAGTEIGQSKFGADSIQIGGTPEEPTFGISIKEDGCVAIKLPDGEKHVSWMDNGDGTFMLMGTTEAEGGDTL